MKSIDQYLEKRGAKYFVAITSLLYVTGTIIFNVYLRSLGSFEFDLLQLRYVFVGGMFLLITSILVLLVWLGYSSFRKAFRKKQIAEEMAMDAAQKEKLRDKKWRRFETIFLIALIPWMTAYSLFIFPEIPSGFGGAKPIAARLIGEVDSIRKINAMIALETGIPADKLPFEKLSEESGLAVGANVTILDRSKDRILLILTKEMYWKSTSNFAKKLIESGKIKAIDTKETKDFNVKPLVVTQPIEGITLSLYEPPAITTEADLKLAAGLIAAQPEAASTVSQVISQDLPGLGDKIVAAVQEKTKQAAAVQASKPQGQTDNTSDVSDVTQSQANADQIEKDITAVIEENVDSVFLAFRADVFNKSIALADLEKLKGRTKEGRLNLVADITGQLTAKFPTDMQQLSPQNYLVTGQGETDFPRKLSQIFQGASNSSVVIKRLNDAQPIVNSDFIAVRDGALTLMNKSAQDNTPENRKAISQMLITYFTQKSRQKTQYWSDPKYIFAAKRDENFLSNMKDALTQTSSWEAFREMLAGFYAALPPEEAEVEETPTTATPDSTSIETKDTSDTTSSSNTSNAGSTLTTTPDATDTPAVVTPTTPETPSTTTPEVTPTTTPTETPPVDNSTPPADTGTQTSGV